MRGLMQERLLARKELMARLGRSSAQAGAVPQPTLRLGRSPRWAESQINALMSGANAAAIEAVRAEKVSVACRKAAANADGGDLAYYFYRLLVTVDPPNSVSAALVADFLNSTMLEAKWFGTYAVVLSDGEVGLIWPRESDVPPEEMGPLVDRMFATPDEPSPAPSCASSV